MKLLLLIILFIIFFPIVKMWMLMRRARRNMEETYNRVRQREQAVSADDKRYSREVGEYADYEDVHGATRETTAEAPGSFTTEEQVVDADFEEL
ncbi:MAG: hypothetical protein IJ775_05370 [Muribaculaceae bacterium]|nr:hypothetical protein [Muribaculaceae bacterium]